MNYYYDTEFLEGTQTKRILGIPYGKTQPTIDLISIGIIAEDGREYYAVSKDFNLREAWNRYDEKVEIMSGDMRNRYPKGVKTKVYWIRENVLKPIFNEWKMEMNSKIVRLGLPLPLNEMEFNYKNFKYCIRQIGKSNKQIATDIRNFVYKENIGCGGQILLGNFIPNEYPEPNFYGYYSAYDHVVLCWLFGKMIDLPQGFPMYTIDLKQELERLNKKNMKYPINVIKYLDQYVAGVDPYYSKLQERQDYPKQTNEHNALNDARWNKQLHEFLSTL